MQTMFKAYVWNPDVVEVQVLKDTGKTITEHVMGVSTGEVLLKKATKETKWYKYCDSKAEAKAWLLLVATNARYETQQKLHRQDAAIADLKKINIHN